MADILKIENLKVDIESDNRIYKVINDISLTIEENSTLGLVGESGCGKTMTALSILKLLPPKATIKGGRIYFNGADILKKSETDLRSLRGKEISMVFQEPSSALNPVFTIGEQIKETVLAHNKDGKINLKDYCLGLLAKVKLRNPEFVFNSYPHNLSGGMRQRAMIAMVLALKPKLLILDEPTTALDVTIQAQILKLIEGLQSEFKMAVLFITHNLGIVAKITKKISIMYAGKIVEEADATAVFYDTKHPYTKGLLESIPFLGIKAKRLAAIKGEAPDLSAIPSGCPFHPRCPLKVDHCVSNVPDSREVS